MYLDEGFFLFEETPQILRVSFSFPLLFLVQLAQLLLSGGQVSAKLLQLAAALTDHKGEPVGGVLKREGDIRLVSGSFET